MAGDHDHKHEHKKKDNDCSSGSCKHEDDHKGHDHKEHDHKGHDHKEHDHKEHDHKEHDHKEHDHKEHDHKEHDHKEHDHKGHDHKEHDHKEHDHKDHGCGHDHDHKEHDHKEHDHKHDEHDHAHSHVHGEDCDDCGPTKRVLSTDDVDDTPVPEWKKKALAKNLNATDAPFGGSWTMESNVSATESSKKEAEKATKSDHAHDHGHSHEHMDHPGHFSERPTGSQNTTERDYTERAFTVGLGGPVGSGKTALMLALCRKLRDSMSVGAVTNDIFTREDGEFLTRNEALPKERIMAVETGGCPHAAIREDISANLNACEVLTASFTPLDIILLESGGDNLAANFSPELADLTLYVIDVAGGDKVPRKGGPGVTQSDVLIINKTDLAEAVGASLEVMKRDAARMRGDGPTVFAQARENLGEGVDEIISLVLAAWKKATSGE